MPTSRPWHAPWPPSPAATWWSTRASRASSTWSPNAPSRPPPPSSSLAALRLQGYTLVKAAGLYKVVPEADAKQQGGSVSVAQGSTGSTLGGGQIVREIFRIHFGK